MNSVAEEARSTVVAVETRMSGNPAMYVGILTSQLDACATAIDELERRCKALEDGLHEERRAHEVLVTENAGLRERQIQPPEPYRSQLEASGATWKVDGSWVFTIRAASGVSFVKVGLRDSGTAWGNAVAFVSRHPAPAPAPHEPVSPSDLSGDWTPGGDEVHKESVGPVPRIALKPMLSLDPVCRGCGAVMMGSDPADYPSGLCEFCQHPERVRRTETGLEYLAAAPAEPLEDDSDANWAAVRRQGLNLSPYYEAEHPGVWRACGPLGVKVAYGWGPRGAVREWMRVHGDKGDKGDRENPEPLEDDSDADLPCDDKPDGPCDDTPGLILRLCDALGLDPASVVIVTGKKRGEAA